MTQDELDALMAGEIDDEVVVLDKEEEVVVPEPIEYDNCPPPPTQEHKVVNQLDDVTRDSEIKANEVFDKLDEINGHLEELDSDLEGVKDVTQNNIELFEKLCLKFPNIESFKEALDQNQNMLKLHEDIKEKSENSSDDILMIMDIMQYQDIHRQKIERVINVMRALSKYMNSLFESDKEDNSRVSSAQHLDGDNAEIVDEDEIEALLASFGKK